MERETEEKEGVMIMEDDKYTIGQIVSAILESKEEVVAVLSSDYPSILLSTILADNLESGRLEFV